MQMSPKQSDSTLVQMQPHSHEVEQEWTWRHFIMNMVMFVVGGVCCYNPFVCMFSMLGLIFSSNAYSTHGDRHYEKARRQNYMAKIFWVLSIVLTIVFFLMVVIALPIIITKAMSAVSSVTEYIPGVGGGDKAHNATMRR